jgi:Glycosyl hydrolases family 25
MSVNVPSAAAPGLFYPDISSAQEDMDLSGVHAVCIKHTEGTYYLNPFYAAQAARAAAAGAFQFAYHFLTSEDPHAQAQFCFSNVGPHVALMADVETQTQTGSKPSLEQNVTFVQSYRALGGTVHLNYLPNWYWSSVWGSPDLAPLKSLGLALVSSDYSGYSTNVGWTAYGGWAPTIWQYSSNVPLHGKDVDFNAFLGSGATDVAALVGEFKSVALTGKLPGSKTWGQWDTAGKRSLQEIAAACGMSPAAVLRATAVRYGRYDQVTHDYVDGILSGTTSAAAKMPAGAKLWVLR